MICFRLHAAIRPSVAFLVLCAVGCGTEGLDRPVVRGVEPPSRDTNGRTQIAILGEQFIPELKVDPAGGSTLNADFTASLYRRTSQGEVENTPLEDVRFASSTRLEAVVPPSLKPTLFGVIVKTPSGHVAQIDDAFTNALKPEMERVEPLQSTVDGGVQVRIFGNYFVDDDTVPLRAAFGTDCPDGASVELADQSLASDEELRGKAPRMPEGTVDVFVTSKYGTGCLEDAFQYVPVQERPVVDSIEPQYGPLAGGITVLIRGRRFSEDAEARIGPKLLLDAQVDVDVGTIQGRLPAGGQAGSVAVEVTVPGAGAGALQAAFEYVAAPVINHVNPSSGPENGGTLVQITGSGFVGEVGEVEVEFDGLLAEDVVVVERGSLLRATTPSGRSSATVTVRAVGGESSRRQSFEYLRPPFIDSVEPDEGPVSGNVTVTIRGGGLDADSLFVRLAD